MYKHQVSIARRKIVQFLQNEITKIAALCESSSTSSANSAISASSFGGGDFYGFSPTKKKSLVMMVMSQDSASPLHNSFYLLPEELVWGEIIPLLSGGSLLQFSCVCRNFYYLSGWKKWWMILVQRKLCKLNLVNQPRISSEIQALGLKEIFVMLRYNFVVLNSATLFLNYLEDPVFSKGEANCFRKQLEDIFYRKLYLASPWRPGLWKERLQQDLLYFKPPSDITVSYTPKECRVRFTMKLDDGFYKGERIDFLAQVSESYPYNPPVVHATCPVYHPFITACGRVRSDLLSRERWKPNLHGMEHVILDVRRLFVDQSYLTSFFTL